MAARRRHPDRSSSSTSTSNRLNRVAREGLRGATGAGVAREQAHKDLPLATYTEAYWNIRSLGAGFL